MKPINGFKEAEPIIGSPVYTLPTGNYKMKIMNAETMVSKTGREMLKVAFDVAEGEFKDFYLRKFEDAKKNNPDKAKWNNDGIYYIFSDEQNLGRFKGFITCLEESNNFEWKWEEKELKGLYFAGQTHNEPSMYNGKVYDHNKLVNIYPVSELENLPKLQDKAVKQEQDSIGGFGGSVDDESSIPF